MKRPAAKTLDEAVEAVQENPGGSEFRIAWNGVCWTVSGLGAYAGGYAYFDKALAAWQEQRDINKVKEEG